MSPKSQPYNATNRFTLEADLLKVLAHPLRLQLIVMLQEKSATVKELWSSLGIPQTTVSQHLGILRSRGVVTGSRKGNTMHYTVTHPIATNLVKVLLKNSS